LEWGGGGVGTRNGRNRKNEVYGHLHGYRRIRGTVRGVSGRATASVGGRKTYGMGPRTRGENDR